MSSVLATLLVVDDEAPIRAMMKTYLSRKGYEILEAEDGMTALALFEAHPEIDLVLTDVHMPKMDGLALTRELMAKDSGLPVMVVTAFSEREIILNALRAGAYDFIPKPVEFEYVLNRLHLALERRHILKAERRLIHLFEDTLGIPPSGDFERLSNKDRLEYLNELATVLSIKFERKDVRG